MLYYRSFHSREFLARRTKSTTTQETRSDCRFTDPLRQVGLLKQSQVRGIAVQLDRNKIRSPTREVFREGEFNRSTQELMIDSAKRTENHRTAFRAAKRRSRDRPARPPRRALHERPPSCRPETACMN
jgi:hypothetical protein